MHNQNNNCNWKGPTIKEIAELSGVGLATVDRVLNNRPGVRDATRKKVSTAHAKLSHNHGGKNKILQIRLYCESGETFNSAMAAAAKRVNRTFEGAYVSCTYVNTNSLNAQQFARDIFEGGGQSDGVVIVAREHPAFNGVIRKLESNGIPVVCLTTDLPSSRCSAYVGNDQYAAGSVAGQLIGNAVSKGSHRILLIMSAAFRCQQEREMGFRRALRTGFPYLKIDDRLVSDDDPETTKEHMNNYIESNGVPAAVYNIAGGNRGVAMALEQAKQSQDTIFVGHELTTQSRALLESGIMNYVISHDFTAELSAAVKWLTDNRKGLKTIPEKSPILVHTRYNCDF